MWTLEQLEPEIDDIRARIVQHRRGLKEYFVARDEEIDLAILCASPRSRCCWSARRAPPRATWWSS
jgi:hypothetical protein